MSSSSKDKSPVKMFDIGLLSCSRLYRISHSNPIQDNLTCLCLCLSTLTPKTTCKPGLLLNFCQDLIVLYCPGYTFPYLYDADQAIAQAYKAMCTPEFYIFDQNQQLAYHGRFDESRPKNDKPVTGVFHTC